MIVLVLWNNLVSPYERFQSRHVILPSRTASSSSTLRMSRSVVPCKRRRLGSSSRVGTALANNSQSALHTFGSSQAGNLRQTSYQRAYVNFQNKFYCSPFCINSTIAEDEQSHRNTVSVSPWWADTEIVPSLSLMILSECFRAASKPSLNSFLKCAKPGESRPPMIST
jgi:hypothetical protein